jgi:hypothetical protein
MYKAPRLERYGTFRELTKVGTTQVTDGCSLIGVDGTVGNGSDILPPGNYPFCVSH